ncbi:MAG: HAD family phosphatase [Dehalococcoidia bacterium]|nr:HAD family phosphatase [Dehalococcoidia bacterium]
MFDMDGVLCDSEPLYLEAINVVLTTRGLRLSEEENREILGTTAEETWRWLKERFRLPGDVAEWLRRYDVAVIETLRGRVTPTSGLMDLLPRLKARDLKMAVASSSELAWVHAILDTLRVREYFSAIVSAGDVERGKPAPDVYLLAARKLGVPPGACLVFEDSPVGLEAAKAAGMRAVAILTPYTRGMDLSRASAVLSSFKEFDERMLD